MLFGIKPDRAATGYGYIRPGPTRIGQSCFKVEAFVEKPDAETAAAYIADGYLWNSGNFMFRAEVLLAEYARFDAATVEAAARPRSRRRRRSRLSSVLDRRVRRAPRCRSISPSWRSPTGPRSFPSRMGWSDIGCWNAIWELADKDADGNAAQRRRRRSSTRATTSSSATKPRSPGRRRGSRWSSSTETRSWSSTGARATARQASSSPQLKARRAARRSTEHLNVFRPWGSYQSIDRRRPLPGQADRGQAGRRGCRCRSTSTAPSTGSWCAAPRS